jgi:hypothetical protein
VVEQLPEHELAYGSEPAWERGEGEAVAEQQPPRASGCKATTSSRGQRLRVVEALLPEKHQALLPARQMSKWFYDTSTGAATGAARCGSFAGGAQIAQGVGYQGIRWTRGFTWFGQLEHNTLRPRVNGVVLLCLSVRLKSLFSALGVCPNLL